MVYSYDTVGNRLSKDVTGPGISTSERYTYDAANKLTHFEQGSDYKDYTYDLRGNLLEVAGVDSEATLRLATAKASVKASMGVDLSVPDSVYSDTDPLAAPILPDADLDSGVTEDVYGVDEALDPASMMKAALAAGPQILESNHWDASNRLIGNTNSSGDVTAYQYDGDGNRVSMKTTLGDSAIQDAYPSSDPAGTRDGWEPQYKKKQLDIYFTNDITMSIPQPLTATGDIGQNWKQSYVYGAGEERISMSYLVSGDASNDWEPSAGDSGTNVSSTPETLYYLSDALGSVIGLEAQDGSISARYQYDEFGVAENPEKFDLNWSGPGNLFGYTSLGYDYYSGYSHAQARDFDSSVGRFINEDTYEGQIDDPQTLNLYTYVSNNPLIYTDPTGHTQEIGDSGFDTRTIGSDGVLYNKNDGSVAWDYYLGWRERDRLGFDKLANSGKGISKEQQWVMRLTLSFITYLDDGSIVLMFESNGQHDLAKGIMEKYGVKKNGKIIVNGTGKFNILRSMGEPYSNHSTLTADSLPRKGKPDSSVDLYDEEGVLKQRRYYGSNGMAQEDIDYEHSNGDGTHTFPHRHQWINGQRQK